MSHLCQPQAAPVDPSSGQKDYDIFSIIIFSTLSLLFPGRLSCSLRFFSCLLFLFTKTSVEFRSRGLKMFALLHLMELALSLCKSCYNVYTHTHIHTYIHVYVHIFMHVHTHTHNMHTHVPGLCLLLTRLSHVLTRSWSSQWPPRVLVYGLNFVRRAFNFVRIMGQLRTEST